MRRWLVAALVPWLLGGCGMYGGLFLEQEAPPAPDAPPIAADEAPADQTPEDDEDEGRANGADAARGEP